MKPVKKILFVCVFFALAFPVFCANVSVLIIETGLSDGNLVLKGEIAGAWETGIMDLFFDSGHIVTNANAFSIKPQENSISGLIKENITEAEDGGVDYFVIGYLKYVQPVRSTEQPMPVSVNFELYNVSSQRCVWKQSEELAKKIVFSQKEESLRAKRAARSLVVHLGDNL